MSGDTAIHLKPGESSRITFSEHLSVLYKTLPDYDGPLVVVPSYSAQVLPFADHSGVEDVIVQPIPNNLVDVSDTTATAKDVELGLVFFTADGRRTEGTRESIDGDDIAYGTLSNDIVGSAKCDASVLVDTVSDKTGFALADIAALVS